MPPLQVLDRATHLSDAGRGPPLLFVHGSCGAGGQWKRLAGALGDRYRLLLLDLPGHGRSGHWPVEKPWSIEVDLRAIEAAIEHAGEPVHLIGHSAGASTSLVLALRRPELFASLSLFEPVMFQLLRMAGHPLFEEPRSLAEDFRAAIDAGETERAMEIFVDRWARKDGVWAAMPEATRAVMRGGAGPLYHGWLNQYRDEVGVEEVARMDLPTLLVSGAETWPSMLEICRMIEDALPRCELLKIPGAGHMSPFTHTSEVLPALEAHIASVCSEVEPACDTAAEPAGRGEAMV